MTHAHFTQRSTITPAQFQKSLLDWYAIHGRHDLPWRHTKDPYAILVSEIMLQQTQVETVLNRFYHPFLEKFPTLTSLKQASPQQVMHAWQGLGYYRRARYLHEIATLTAPVLPDTLNALISLPGLGRNTAHALLAFAHHQPYAVMEANVKRIICRLFALTSPSHHTLWEYAELLLNHTNPFDHNQAMMDLGALVCTAKKPSCASCPVQSHCLGKKAPEKYHIGTQKRPIPLRQQQIIIVKDREGHVYATPRQGNLLGGLYQFIELDKNITAISLNNCVYKKEGWQKLGDVRQKYSHFTLQAEVFCIDYDGLHQKDHWHKAAELHNLPWSAAEKKILRLLPI